MNNRVFGEIEGFSNGAMFSSREELSKAGLHRPTQAGISGSALEGADSIVLSGGYDDLDYGVTIIYTGHGGLDSNTGDQVTDQELTRQNLALVLSKDQGFPVRVIRGFGGNSQFSPASGYRYDGLYYVEDYWKDEKDGHTIYRFKLVKLPEDKFPPARIDVVKEQLKPVRVKITSYRIVRDTEKSREIKKLYDFTCQVCGVRLEGPSGPYAEGAHIQPLGEPHNGIDDESNILCLCPNDHVLFDKYAFTIADDFSLIGKSGVLKVHSQHKIDARFLQYRRSHYGKK